MISFYSSSIKPTILCFYLFIYLFIHLFILFIYDYYYFLEGRGGGGGGVNKSATYPDQKGSPTIDQDIKVYVYSK